MTWRTFTTAPLNPNRPDKQFLLTNAQAKVYTETYLATDGIHDERRAAAWKAAVNSA